MTFGCYDLEDLRQEARVECLLALEKYDGKRPLPNFLRTCVKSRYINLRRNKFHRKGDSDDHPKKLLMMPIDIDAVDHDGEPNMSIDICFADNKDLWEKLDEELPLELRHDYLRLKNGEDISRIKRNKIMEVIKNILWKISQES